MIVYMPPKPAQAIPVIDLRPSFSTDPDARKRTAWDIHKACRETGFFYVANHNVPRQLLDDQMAFTRRFFALPLADKLAIDMKKSPASAGYEPIGGQVLDSQDPNSEQAPPDLKESFYCGMELPPSHPWAQKKIRTFGHNLWPEIPGFREQMIQYQDALRRLGDHVLSLLALSLELPDNHFASFYDMPQITLRLLRYPPHPASAAANQLGAGAHTDWGGITLLLQDELGGLEVRNIANEWIEASPVPGTFVVNLGDLMQRWTNGIYRSNMHRVKNNSSSRDRYSVPFFYSPRPDSRIECLATCTDEKNPPHYSPCTASEHIAEMFRRSYGYAPA
jgi:isopenicillin N synthase-like dioxygenase